MPAVGLNPKVVAVQPFPHRHPRFNHIGISLLKRPTIKPIARDFALTPVTARKNIKIINQCFLTTPNTQIAFFIITTLLVGMKQK